MADLFFEEAGSPTRNGPMEAQDDPFDDDILSGDTYIKAAQSVMKSVKKRGVLNSAPADGVPAPPPTRLATREAEPRGSPLQWSPASSAAGSPQNSPTGGSPLGSPKGSPKAATTLGGRNARPGSSLGPSRQPGTDPGLGRLPETPESTVPGIDESVPFALRDDLPSISSASPSLRDGVDNEVDDITDILTEGTRPFTAMTAMTGATEDDWDQSDHVPLPAVVWRTPEIKVLDKVGTKTVQMSLPTPRSGHSLVYMSDPRNLLVCFGGYAIGDEEGAEGRGFQSYATALLNSEQAGPVYFNDVFHYHTIQKIWMKVRRSAENDQPVPAGRYGHCALQLDERRMWVFGGRCAYGLCSSEVFLYDVITLEWTKVSGVVGSGIELRGEDDNGGYTAFLRNEPCPRYEGGATRVRDRCVLLFGGRDTDSTYGDLWSWDLQTEEWTNVITVGTPPLPRFGHKLLAVSKDREVLILGGCCVQPRAEEGYSPEGRELERLIEIAGQMLSRCYEMEGVEAVMSGAEIIEQAQYMNVKELARFEALVAARMADREKSTQLAAERLMDLQKQRAMELLRVKKSAVHPYKTLDLCVLDVQNMSWSLPDLPRIRGDVPLARYNYCCALIGKKRIVVWGGTRPSAGAPAPVDPNVYVLDLRSRVWVQPKAENSPEEVLPQLQAARTELRRAVRLVAASKDTAKMRGISEAECYEVAEANARLEVCRWRVGQVEQQMASTTEPPESRWAAASVGQGFRVAILGGVCSDDASRGFAPARYRRTTAEFLMLDLEPPDEYRRRIEEEFHARLEMERSQRELAELQQRRLEEYQRRKAKEAELKREKEERRLMYIEDILSSFPPKTRPKPVRVLARSPNTIWFEWDRTEFDAWEKPVYPGDVTYVLSTIGGYKKFDVGDPCRVLYIDRADRSDTEDGEVSIRSISAWLARYATGEEVGLELTRDDDITVKSGTFQDLGYDESLTQATAVTPATAEDAEDASGIPWPVDSIEAMAQPARVTRVHVDGTIDVRYSDGGKEQKIPRWRVFERMMPQPTVVYMGEEVRTVDESQVIAPRERATSDPNPKPKPNRRRSTPSRVSSPTTSWRTMRASPCTSA
uniref:Uncharacterized protein n=1 Tax=Phaeomonas parva TaxID=124430 RepID=A0A7S1U9S6_9STRA|mmetsp:Transcript_3824/g.11045  ORF Transcript_3824/g.11045 Transcript_3824/m.11045 type:complete len:1098 (+) Transcript_3824:124-3417(+)